MDKQINQRWQSLLLATIATVIMLGASSTSFAHNNFNAKPVKQTKRAAPTKEIVEKVLKSYWDKSEANYPNVKVTLTLNEVKFGKDYGATVQEVQVEGFPKGAIVTPAIVDFTVRTYYNKETQAVRRVREARVYRDKFDEWAVSTGSVRGEDTTTTEPAGGARTEVPTKDKPPTTKNDNQTTDKPADKDENGFPKPDFSEMEKYFEIVRTDYDFSLGRYNLLVKAKKKTNIFEWYLTFYDADGIKVSDRSFNGNLGSPEIGEPTKIYGYTPTEKEMKQVTRITITRKPF